MNPKTKKEKTFDTVKVFREIKEKIAKETEKMTFAEFKEYLKKNKLTNAK
jgi:CO dehydrogenase/acetyl-CoA synthase beta subunit